MQDLLQKIVNHLSEWNPNFGYGDPTKNGVTINNVGGGIPVDRMVGSTEKIIQFSVYSWFDKYITAFMTANDIYNYLQKNKIIADSNLRILNVFAPTRVILKQNKHLFVVEFQLIGI